MRQKILVKGGKLTDDIVVSSLKLNPTQPIMVLGTPDKNLPTKPVEKTVFLEDLNQNQLFKVSSDPSGLVNLGNTCYLNSSLQILFLNPDIREKLAKFQSTSSSPSKPVIVSLKSMFDQMAKKQEKVTPTLFLTLFRNVFPQFAEKGDGGYFKQQDAEEAYSQLMTVLAEHLRVDDYFKLSLKSQQKCLAVEEPVEVKYEDALKLNCHIDIKTNFLRDGIMAGLKETIEKNSPTLGTNAEYEITRTITRLPKYLTIQFVRFFWRTDTRKKSKILRRVQFPFELDLADMLDESIKQDKVEVRDKLHTLEKDNLDLIRDFKKQKKDDKLTPLEQQEEDELKVESIKSKFQDELVNILPQGYDLEASTENPSSVYELSAIITHAGASADSGHYQAYVKDQSDIQGVRWWKFNDDKVSVVNRERVEMLAGGGESDSALILVYKGVGL